MPDEEETQELLDVPLRGGGSSTSNSDSDTEGLSRKEEPCGLWRVAYFLMDVVASVLFWYVLLFVYIPDNAVYTSLVVLAVSMLLWRLYRAYAMPSEGGDEVPYTCGVVTTPCGKEMFLVATIHISPRAPKDVELVIDKTRPDVAMIELDDERLDRMRDRPEPAEQGNGVPRPKLEDLQPIRITKWGSEPFTIHAQRALWNAEWTDKRIQGDIVFDECNSYGLTAGSDELQGSIALMQRGSPNGEFAPFALKAHNAYAGGAEAVFIINNSNSLPLNRVGGGSVTGDLQVALKTCNCGFPPIPLLLLPQTEGEKLRDFCRQSGSATSGDLQILADNYPRRTLRLRLCQACALMFSGIGILYGVIQCFSVEVGAEFLAAEEAATARGIPCTCIDVDLNRFWSRLGMTVLPTPCNLLNSLWAWLAFPRVAFQVLFPPRDNIDVVGGMFLHGASFPLKTWIAFLFAGFCASTVTNKILELLGYGATKAAESSGAIKPEDANVVQAYIMLLVEMYMLPQIYDAVAASRDEAMYQSIVTKSRKMKARRMVVVVGAGHANGILQRARNFGL